MKINKLLSSQKRVLGSLKWVIRPTFSPQIDTIFNNSTDLVEDINTVVWRYIYKTPMNSLTPFSLYSFRYGTVLKKNNQAIVMLSRENPCGGHMIATSKWQTVHKQTTHDLITTKNKRNVDMRDIWLVTLSDDVTRNVTVLQKYISFDNLPSPREDRHFWFLLYLFTRTTA